VIAPPRDDATLGMGAAPKIAVSGLNPHAGEGGLFGREEIEIIRPAMDTVAAEGLSVAGPFGADTMFYMPGFDAFVVMLHDQGHIPQNYGAERGRGAVDRRRSCSHRSRGTGHDIAGKGVTGGDDRSCAATGERGAARRLPGVRRHSRSAHRKHGAFSTCANQSKPISLTIRMLITIRGASALASADGW
jgi:hypothetical protein